MCPNDYESNYLFELDEGELLFTGDSILSNFPYFGRINSWFDYDVGEKLFN